LLNDNKEELIMILTKKRTNSSKLVILATLLNAFLGSTIAHAEGPPDWSKIPSNTVNLFYPGQSSYQWLSSPQHKRANKQVRKGEACESCHEGEEQDIGAVIVSGEKLEPHPLAGKPAVIGLNVKIAYDKEYVYFRFKWKTSNPYPGTAHPHWQFDGVQWKQLGWPRLHKKVWQDGQPAIYEDRFSMMLDDGSVPMFAEQGCWLSCHTAMRDMPEVAKRQDVKAHSFLGRKLKKKDVRKYLPSSRTDEAFSWNKVHSNDMITKLKEKSGFVDLMQWRAHRSHPIDMADDGYVLEYRLTDAGKNIFSKNWDKSRNQPKYMFDEKIVGFRSRTLSQIRDLSQPSSLVEGMNAISFDPTMQWAQGEMIPEYVVSRSMAKGSAADNSMVQAKWDAGYWTLEWQRKLDTGHPNDDKILKEGLAYTFGFAVHDDNITTRGHHVSFPISVGFGAKARIEATKVN